MLSVGRSSTLYFISIHIYFLTKTLVIFLILSLFTQLLFNKNPRFELEWGTSYKLMIGSYLVINFLSFYIIIKEWHKRLIPHSFPFVSPVYFIQIVRLLITNYWKLCLYLRQRIMCTAQLFNSIFKYPFVRSLYMITVSYIRARFLNACTCILTIRLVITKDKEVLIY